MPTVKLRDGTEMDQIFAIIHYQALEMAFKNGLPGQLAVGDFFDLSKGKISKIPADEVEFLVKLNLLDHGSTSTSPRLRKEAAAVVLSAYDPAAMMLRSYQETTTFVASHGIDTQNRFVNPDTTPAGTAEGRFAALHEVANRDEIKAPEPKGRGLLAFVGRQWTRLGFKS